MILLQRTIVTVALMAALLGGCGSVGGSIGDTMPQSMGGLPADAPARPTDTNQRYLGVHDMPAPRSTTPMSEEGQVKLEKDLQVTRDRQAAATKDDAAAAAPATPAAAPAAKKTDKKADKKQADTKASDAKTSGAKPNP